jgi:Rrf2 family protein
LVISRTAEYALRAVVHLAAVEGESVSQTVGQIAAGTRVPAGYLAKVLQSLSRSGIIASQRGLGGGFRLARTAPEISVYEVIHAVDPIKRIRECPLGLDAHGTNLCPLHRRLDDATALIENQFRATTIAELVEKPQAGRKSSKKGMPCLFPREVVPATSSRARNSAVQDEKLRASAKPKQIG